MDLRFLFVSGMFRSGTTFLARLLNTHSNIVCASDPLRPMFNSFRYDMATDKYRTQHNRYDPLDDYFLSDVDLLSNILTSDLNVEIGSSIEELQSTVVTRAAAFSGSWAESFSIDKQITHYHQVIDAGLKHVNSIYGNQDEPSSWIAFKEVWANEMLPAFLRSFPEAKGIIIVRDPRAVVASNRVNATKYPILFLTRQWRKLTFLARYVEQQFPEQVLVLRYEDLIGQYPQTLEKLLAFLGEDVEPQMLDSSTLRDGDNKQWTQNTSYDYQSKSIVEKRSIDKWREVLDKRDIKAIELVCQDLMHEFSYQTEISNEELINIHYQDLSRLSLDELSEWIRPYSFDDDEDRFANEIVKEKMRLAGILSGMAFNEYEQLALQFWRK